MADDFEVHEMKDGRVLVVLHPTCSTTREEILTLLAKLGVDKEAVAFVLPEEVAENCNSIDDEPVLIPIDKASCDAPELEVAGRQCAEGGGRVVVLFCEGFPYEGLHPIADKYGTQCGWSAEQIKGCVKGSEPGPPRDSGGGQVARPKSAQVKC